VPKLAVPNLAVSNLTVPNLAEPNLAVPLLALLNLKVPNLTVTNFTVTNLTVPLVLQFVLSGSTDGRIHVWNAETGFKLCVLNGGHVGPVQCVQFNPSHLVSTFMKAFFIRR
jgi:WD40 repeat protein